MKKSLGQTAFAVERRRGSGHGLEEPAMDSWTTTRRLMMVMAAVAVSYVVGRWLAETLQDLTASGALPSF